MFRRLFLMKKINLINKLTKIIYLFLLQEGKRGYLEGLAAHYSKQINMPYEDVLDAIEQVRLSKWKERHVRISTGHTLTRRSGGASGASSGSGSGSGSGSSSGGNSRLVGSSVLPTSHSQPLYVPGKYLVSKVHIDFLWLTLNLTTPKLISSSSNSCHLLCTYIVVHAAIELPVKSGGERDL